MEHKNGFTLIELLVVIAIIAMLSSVVLAALGNARSKGGNSAVKANLSNLRSYVALYYNNNNGSFSSLCADATETSYQTAAQNAGGGTSSCLSGGASGSQVWAVSVQLKTPEIVGANTYNYWCVDWTGVSKGEAASSIAGSVCP